MLVDRLDRKKVMIACDVGRGLVLLALPFVKTVFGLVILSFLLEVGTLLWSPAKEASVPNLVPAERLTTVNSLSIAAAYGTFPIATILFTGLTKLAEWLGHYNALDFLKLNSESVAIYFDALTFFVSAILISHDSPRAPCPRPRVGRRQALRPAPGLQRPPRGLPLHPHQPGGARRPAGSRSRTDRRRHVGAARTGIRQECAPRRADGIRRSCSLRSASAWRLVCSPLSVMQKHLKKTSIFSMAVFVAGVSLILAASSDRIPITMAFVFALGICAGAVYVLGFTVLHESVEDDLRGRIFSTLYTLVRFCLLLAFAVGPFMTDLLDRLSKKWFDRKVDIGVTIALPGVRLTLWLAGLIILGAGSSRSPRSARPAPPVGYVIFRE